MQVAPFFVMRFAKGPIHQSQSLMIDTADSIWCIEALSLWRHSYAALITLCFFSLALFVGCAKPQSGGVEQSSGMVLLNAVDFMGVT